MRRGRLKVEGRIRGYNSSIEGALCLYMSDLYSVRGEETFVAITGKIRFDRAIR